MDANGKNQQRITNNPAWDGDPEWSPCGRMIVFMSERDGNKDVFVINSDGKNPRNLTKHPAYDGSPYWFDPAFVHPVARKKTACVPYGFQSSTGDLTLREVH
jgi:hypothetical protein